MIRPRLASTLPRALVSAFVLVVTLASAPPSAAADAPQPPASVDLAEMMKQAERWTKPGEPHRLLARLLGDWESETSITMPGPKTPPARGTSRGSWLMDGRWLRFESDWAMMGMPIHGFILLGYDNFKMSYVTTFVSSMDTAMTYAEGDVDPKTGALVLYGTLDEYLTGEHDKMVKYVWRFDDADTIRFEVHDLPIGEADAQVVGVVFRRKPAS